MSHAKVQPVNVRVWDLPTRGFHWALALTLVASVASAQIDGDAMIWHLRFGYAVFTLLAFRVLWGLVGGRWSRFSSFIHAPGTVIRYLRGWARADEHLDVGHNPVCSFAVIAMLALLAAQVATGLLAGDESTHAGPVQHLVSAATARQATHWHNDFGPWLLLALVALHVAAVAYYLRRKKIDLVRPMLVGDKALPAGTPGTTDSAATRLLALLLFTLCAAGVAWVAGLGGQ